MTKREQATLKVHAHYEVYDGNAGRKVPNPDRPEEVADMELFVLTFEEGTHPAFVSVKMGMTMNLGNYESARVDCSVSLPCYPEEHQVAMEAAARYCEDAVRRVVRGTRAGQKVLGKFDAKRRGE